MTAGAVPRPADAGAGPIERAIPFDVLLLIGFLALLAPMARRVGAGVHDMTGIVTVVAALVLGVAATDLTSGVVHWFCDTFFAEDTPVLGRLLIGPFREHHTDPLAMTRRDVLCTNRTNLAAIVVGLLVLAWVRSGSAYAPSLFADAWWVAYALAIALTNETHKLAHRPDVPAAAAWLQARGLIVSPARHARHHDGAHGRSFCVTTGWCNPLLDRTALFDRVERWMGRRPRGLTRRGAIP